MSTVLATCVFLLLLAQHQLVAGYSVYNPQQQQQQSSLSVSCIGRRVALLTTVLWSGSTATNAFDTSGSSASSRMNNKKLIVITGATRGIGSALMVEFTKLGHTVFGCGSTAKSVDSFLKQHPTITGMTSIDICDSDQVQAWAESILKAKGAPDLLINNAGVIHDNAPFTSIKKEDFDRVIDVNIKGTANVLRSFLPAMIARKQGVIVNLTSGAGKRGYPEISGYCTSKFGVEGISQSIAKELPEGMAIIPLQPGVINTDMLQQHFGGERANTYQTPSDWAKHGAPYILNLGPEHNGQSLRIPDPPESE